MIENLALRNPSDQLRTHLLEKSLVPLDREEDVPYILQAMRQPEDIRMLTKGRAFHDCRIAVIGAGLAGLSATYELAKLGCKIILFEGSPSHIGGRVFTHFFNDGNYGELGPMRIPVSHQSTWHYINRFGLSTRPFINHCRNDILFVKNERFFGQTNDIEIMRRLYPHYALTPTKRLLPLSILQQNVYNAPLLPLPPSAKG